MIASLIAAAVAAAPTPTACPVGLFQSPDGKQQVVVTALRQNLQRYMFIDGRRGTFGDASADLACSAGEVVSRNDGGKWIAVPLRRTEAEFTSHGQRLTGTLIEPPTPSPRPLVVLVHGSEKFSPMEHSHPYMFAAHGIAVFAYDKRGTGKSEGEYTQNFELLADDAAAAMGEARRLAAERFTRAGFFGGSQGGWVAPLAATRSHADFVAVGYGLVASPLEEDRDQVLSEMKARGYGEPDLSQAREVADAAGRLVSSHFTSGFERLAEVKRRHGAKPWLRQIKGEFTGDILKISEADLRRIGRALYDNLELIWDYDSLTVLRKVRAPQLWIIAEADREAPPETTLGALTKLRDAGKNVAVYSFPGTDHGMFEFTQSPDGSRTTTRLADGYFRLLTDWIKGRLTGGYGRARRR